FSAVLSFGTSLSVTALAAVQDAWYASFDAGTGAVLELRKAGAASGETASGTGVDVDAPTGDMLFTGHLTGNIPVLYGVSGTTTFGSGGLAGKARSYVLNLSGASLNWCRQITSATSSTVHGNVRSSGISARGNKVFVTGTFDDNITTPVSAYGTFTSSSSTS